MNICNAKKKYKTFKSLIKSGVNENFKMTICTDSILPSNNSQNL